MDDLKENIKDIVEKLNDLSDKLSTISDKKYNRYEIAQMLGVNPMTIYRHMKAGILKSELVGKAFKSSLKDIEEYKSKL